MQGESEPRGRRRSLLLGLAVLLLLALLGLGLWAWQRIETPPPAEVAPAGIPPDPRLAYRGPYQNINPAIRYVGDAACAECHPKIAASYHHHPMARSLLPIAAVASKQVYDRQHNDPFYALHSRFTVERQGDQVLERQERLGPAGTVLYKGDEAANYVIGSGKRGYSYLTDHDGYLFQTAISWYSQKNIWDLSPGFQARGITRRPVDGLCLFCHANQARFRETSVNHYEPPIFHGFGIGCERCHGPGELHVKEGGVHDPKTGADYAIVNPKRLTPELREAVCQQCHLEGAARVLRRGRHLYDFRPGLPLSSFWSVFVYSDESEQGHPAVNHVEQMYQSQCFLRSKGEKKLGCISCHDPHAAVAPAESVAYYRQRCLKCHDTGSCNGPAAERKARADSCIACHMPRYGAADVPHTAATDHRIPRRPGHVSAKVVQPGPPLASFFPSTGQPNKALSRDLGIGLVTLMVQGQLDPTLQNPQAVSLLESALRRDPDDVEAWQARAQTLLLAKNSRGALDAFETALRLSPQRETCLAGAAALAQQLGEAQRARDYWGRAVAANPWMAEYRAGLAPQLADAGAWKEALAQARAWVRLDPESVPARLLLIRSLVKTGRPQEARTEFETTLALRPADSARLRAWFREQDAMPPVRKSNQPAP
jgi:predicted CXXCH cytochrome family protein